MTYSPPRRTIPVRVLTVRGWIDGTLALPSSARLVEWLDHADAFVTLTDVRLEASGRALPYVSLRRDAIRIVVPVTAAGAEPTASAPERSRHRVQVLLDVAMARGTIETLPGIRVSDALAHRDGLVELHDAVVRAAAEGGAPVEEALGSALVAARHVIAVTETP